MSRSCKTCSHPRRSEIELAVLNNEPYRSIGARFGLNHVSIVRHVQNGHIAAVLVEATELRKVAYSEDLLEKLMYLQHEALKILSEAKNPKEGNPLLNTALNAIGKVNRLLETQAKLAGQLKEFEINISANPHWIAIKQQIFATLRTFPDARDAVLEAIGNGKLTELQKRMIEPDPVSPAVLDLICRTLGEDIEPDDECRAQYVLEQEKD